jgi:hypothetical protein
VPQVVSVQHGSVRLHYDGVFPEKQAAQAELLGGLLEALHAPGLLRRLRGWRRVVGRIWRGM